MSQWTPLQYAIYDVIYHSHNQTTPQGARHRARIAFALAADIWSVGRKE